MYFWNIEALTQQLVSGEMTQQDLFKYLLANTIVYAIALIPVGGSNSMDVLGGWLSVCISVGGVYLVYHFNGGANGRDILARYLTVAWVIAIRWLVMVAIPVFVLSAFLQLAAFGTLSEETSAIDVMVFTVVEVLYFAWVARRINLIARQTAYRG